jgi:RNA polymerase sigma-70 factor (ECF subfamily)
MRDAEDVAPFEPVAAGLSPFEHAAAAEDKARIQAALDELPAIFREVLVLRFQEHMKLEEIAKLVGIPLATVKTRLYRGVMALRPMLGGGAL